MPQDQGKREAGQRSGEREYEIAYLMKTHGITRDRAIDLIDRHDGDRERIALELSAG